MNKSIFAAMFFALTFFACTNQRSIILKPDPVQDMFEQTGPLEKWQIIESQNGPPENGIPEWVSLFLNKGITGIVSLEQHSDKYFLIGKNSGANLKALKQWADNLSEVRDFPGLLVQRAEFRLVSSASLYPDDEYGEYFENMIKQVSDDEYHGVVKEQVFWIKQKHLSAGGEDEDNTAEEQPNFIPERYEIFVLLSIDKEALQIKIRQLMANIKTVKPPTKEQALAINKIRNTFFEGF